jgi:sulfur carrier protein ThiS
MKLLKLLSTLITESRLFDRFVVNGLVVDVTSTRESDVAVMDNTTFGRVPKEEILESMRDIIEVIVTQGLVVLDTCERRCGLLVSDYSMGFDYQLWVTMKTNKLELKINTSIKHPKQLFNDKFKTRRVIVTKDGETVIKESLEHYRSVKIGKKIVYFID